MSHEHPNLGDRPSRIPAARRPQREVGIREHVRTEDKSSALQEWLNELTVTSALSRAEVPRTIRRNTTGTPANVHFDEVQSSIAVQGC